MRAGELALAFPICSTGERDLAPFLSSRVEIVLVARIVELTLLALVRQP